MNRRDLGPVAAAPTAAGVVDAAGDARSDALVLPTELTRRSMVVAIATTAGLMASYSTVGNALLGLFVVPVTHAFGIGRGTFGLITGLAMLIGAALTPFAGQAFDRFGVRRVILPGIAVFGTVQILLSIIPVSVPLLATLLVLQGAVSCILSPLAYAKVLALWFRRRRGLMLGVGSAIGIGGGTTVSIALVSALMAAGGWREGYLGTGLYVLAVGALVVAPFVREPPSVERAQEGQGAADLPGLTRRDAVRTRGIQLLLLLVVGCIGALAIMMGHGPALLASRGLSIGPLYLGCLALGSMVGQMISGVLLDRINSPKVGLPFALATLIGGVTILQFGTTAAIVVPAAVLMGLGQGAETGLASYYISRFCGLRAYGAIFGLVMSVVTLSAGTFPAIAGYVFDHSGSYHSVIPLIELLLILPPLAIVLMPAYRYNADPSVAAPVH